ncbi:hypothetical protein SK069_05915 [Patulibacter brassicae]|uniref:Uncharacterized protein n=1 Tax=Patulibacter brassicae TaxID=1705717 RepID=A0ABU4VH23_9ACTN|nr:hypothetical protein [Patulibacter brassicae]MDX8151121.1 hypothetical protein [Patulibacter brassicae]
MADPSRRGAPERERGPADLDRAPDRAKPGPPPAPAPRRPGAAPTTGDTKETKEGHGAHR